MPPRKRIHPTKEEVTHLANLLLETHGPAKVALRHYITGHTSWEYATPILRQLCTDLVTAKRIYLRADVRDAVKAFVTKYGIVRPHLYGEPKTNEPMTVLKNTRWTASMWDDVLKAAANAGVDPTDYIRQTVLRQARMDIAQRNSPN